MGQETTTMTVVNLITPEDRREIEEAVRDNAFARNTASRTATVETDDEEDDGGPSWD
jgi:hypothetical protein